MNQSLITYNFDHDPKASVLRTLIAKRRNVLMQKITKLEALKEQLARIEYEHNSRIGALQRRIALVELAINKLQRIADLMDVGLSYKEALTELEEIDASKKEWAKAQQEHDKITMPKFDEEDEVANIDIKKLWKNLVRKFHPDLVANKEEKKKREKIMQRINTAFAEGDMNTLQSIDAQGATVEEKANSLKELELQLEYLENAIIRIEKEYRELTNSQWYSYLKAGVKKRQQLFAELEATLSSEFTVKEKQLTELEQKFDSFTKDA